MYLPTPTDVATISSMEDYHIVSFGDMDSTHVITVFQKGECRDSYIVAAGGFERGGQYITIPFVK